MPRFNIRRGSMHEQFLNSRKKIQVLGGGFGNGKTATSCVKAISVCYDYPGANILIARATYPKLNDTIRKEFFKWIPREHVKRHPTKDDNTAILTNGTTVNFRYISQKGKMSAEGETKSNLLSATYDLIVVDQLEDPEITIKDFLDLHGRLRGSTPYKGSDETMPMTGPRFMILTLNPTANWCYKKLIKPYHMWKATGLVGPDLLVDENTMEPIIELFEGSTMENADNLPEDFIQTLRTTYKGQMYDRYVLGKWAAYEGLVYPQYSAETHMIPKAHIMEMLENALERKSPFLNFEIFDFGQAVPSCYCLGIIDYRGRVIIVDGFHKANMSIDDIGSAILEIRNRYGDYIEFENPIWADPAIFRRTVVDGKGKGQTTTIKKLLTTRFDLQFTPGQNDKLSGIVKVGDYLAPRKGMHYLSEKEEGPMLYFCDELQFIDDEFVSYFWKTDPKGERIDEPRDGGDDFLDALKYGVSKLPQASELHFRRPIITPEYLQWHEAN